MFVTKNAQDSNDASKTLFVHNALLFYMSQQSGKENEMVVTHITVPSTAMQSLYIFYFIDRS